MPSLRRRDGTEVEAPVCSGWRVGTTPGGGGRSCVEQGCFCSRRRYLVWHGVFWREAAREGGRLGRR